MNLLNEFKQFYCAFELTVRTCFKWWFFCAVREFKPQMTKKGPRFENFVKNIKFFWTVKV